MRQCRATVGHRLRRAWATLPPPQTLRRTWRRNHRRLRSSVRLRAVRLHACTSAQPAAPPSPWQEPAPRPVTTGPGTGLPWSGGLDRGSIKLPARGRAATDSAKDSATFSLPRDLGRGILMPLGICNSAENRSTVPVAYNAIADIAFRAVRESQFDADSSR